MEVRLFKCEKCGNIVLKLVDGHTTPHCCGQPMKEIHPAVIEGKEEHHLPVVHRCEDGHIKVCIGKESHPMTPEHRIEFVILQTPKGCLIRHLEPGQEPILKFPPTSCGPITVYAYCNLHGLWKTEFGKQPIDNCLK